MDPRGRQAATGLNFDRQVLGVVGRLLPGFFPHLPHQSQYNRRLRRLTPLHRDGAAPVAALVAEGRIRLTDGTLIAAPITPAALRAASTRRTRARLLPLEERVRVGDAAVLESDVKGVPTGYDLVPAGAKEYEPVYGLAEPGCLLFCDKGLWGREFRRSLELIDVELITPTGTSPESARPPSRQGAHPARRRVGYLEPQAPDAPRRSPRPRRSRGSRSGSPNACSRSRSPSSATSWSDAPPGRSSHMTGAEPTSGLQVLCVDRPPRVKASPAPSCARP